ncbi:MAG: hypothetical protein PHH98_03070 [Candidatus Gracilibacteria bacterium]|nr:hypothetical protein [Candidatus Gracilibacteria bacterium]
MKNTEIINQDKLNLNNTEVSNLKLSISELNNIKDKLLDSSDIYNIKGIKYINKKGYRKIALAFNISTQIINEKRILDGDNLIYDFTVRASTPMGRYTEASSSCSSNERDFTHLNHDVRATAQTRATNRAISDLLGITDIIYYISGIINSNVNTENNYDNGPVDSDNNIDTHNITLKQRKLLESLITEVIENEDEQKAYIETLDELSKYEANFHIRELLDMKNGTN